MELNYRPSIGEEDRSSGGALTLAAILIQMVAGLLWLVGCYGPLLSLIVNLVGAAIFAQIAIKQISHDGPRRGTFALSLVRGGVITLAVLVAFYFIFHDLYRIHYVLAVGPPLAAAVVFAYLVARHFAFWATANPLVEWRETRQWRTIWRTILFGRISPECPEALTCRLAIVVLFIQFWIGYEVWGHAVNVQQNSNNFNAAALMALLVVALPLPLYWIA